MIRPSKNSLAANLYRQSFAECGSTKSKFIGKKNDSNKLSKTIGRKINLLKGSSNTKLTGAKLLEEK